MMTSRRSNVAVAFAAVLVVAIAVDGADAWPRTRNLKVKRYYRFCIVYR